jgi:hypothetical protein
MMGKLFGQTRFLTRKLKYVKELDGELSFHVDELTELATVGRQNTLSTATRARFGSESVSVRRRQLPR